MGNSIIYTSTRDEKDSSSSEEEEIGTFYGKNNAKTGRLEFDWDLYKKSIKEFTERSKKLIIFEKEIKVISNQLKLEDDSIPEDSSRTNFKSLTKIFIMYNVTITELIKLVTMNDEIINGFYNSDTAKYSLPFFNSMFSIINDKLEIQEDLKGKIEGYANPIDNEN